MRRILAVVCVVSAVALGGCGADAEAESPAPAPTSALAVDAKAATAAACTEAVTISKAGAVDFQEGFDDLLKVAVEGDDAAADAAEKAFRATLTAWSDKLTEIAAQPVDADVKTVLTESAATVAKVADPADKTPVNAATEQLGGIAEKISAACA